MKINRSVINLLVNYKKDKAYIEATKLRVQQIESVLKSQSDDEIEYFFKASESYYGMPKAKGTVSDPTANTVISKQTKMTILKKWVEQDKGKIGVAKLRVDQIDLAIKSLQEEQLFIVQARYVEDRSWKSVEHEFNYRYRSVTSNFVTETQVRRIGYTGLNKLEEVFKYMII